MQRRNIYALLLIFVSFNLQAVMPDGDASTSKKTHLAKKDPRYERITLVPSENPPTLSPCTSIEKKEVTAVTFLSDNACKAFGKRDGTIEITDKDGHTIGTLSRHTHAITSLHISPDGRHLYSVSKDKTANVWDLNTLTAQTTLKGHNSWVNDVSTSPYDNITITGSRDQLVKLWDIRAAKKSIAQWGHTQPVLSVALSTHSSKGISGSRDNKAYVVDIRAFRPHQILPLLHDDWVNGTYITANGKKAFSLDAHKIVHEWDLDKSKECTAYMPVESESEYTYPFKSYITSLAAVLAQHKHCSICLNENESTLLSTVDEKAILWDTQNLTFKTVLSGHNSTIIAACIGSDCKSALTASLDNSVKIWKLPQLKEEKKKE